MRITVTLDDATHERLVEWAAADWRSVAGTAAMLIEFALTNDENALLNVPAGVRGHGIQVTEHTPSKPLPPIDDHREFLEQRGPATKEQPVTTVIPEGCSHPRDKRQVHGWGTLCGLCNEKVS